MRILPLLFFALCVLHLCSASKEKKPKPKKKANVIETSDDDDDYQPDSRIPPSRVGRATRSRPAPASSDEQPEDLGFPLHGPVYDALDVEDRALLHFHIGENPTNDEHYALPDNRHEIAEPDLEEDHEFHSWYSFKPRSRRSGIWTCYQSLVPILNDISLKHGGTFLVLFGRPEENPAQKNNPDALGVMGVSRSIARDPGLSQAADRIFEDWKANIAQPRRNAFQDLRKRAKAVAERYRAQCAAETAKAERARQEAEKARREKDRRMRSGSTSSSKRAASSDESDTSRSGNRKKIKIARAPSRDLGRSRSNDDNGIDTDRTPRKTDKKGKGRAEPEDLVDELEDDDDDDGSDDVATLRNREIRKRLRRLHELRDSLAASKQELEELEALELNLAIEESNTLKKSRAPDTAGQSSRQGRLLSDGQRPRMIMDAVLLPRITSFTHPRPPSQVPLPDSRPASAASNRADDTTGLVDDDGVIYISSGDEDETGVTVKKEENPTTLRGSNNRKPHDRNTALAEDDIDLPAGITDVLQGANIPRVHWARIEAIWRSGAMPGVQDRMGYYEDRLERLGLTAEAVLRLVLCLLRRPPP